MVRMVVVAVVRPVAVAVPTLLLAPAGVLMAAMGLANGGEVEVPAGLAVVVAELTMVRSPLQLATLWFQTPPRRRRRRSLRR